MSDGFATQPGDLEAAGGRFDEAARIVTAALENLRSTLGGLGDYVGSDEQGKAFAAQYDPSVAEGFDAMGKEAEGLRSLGEALRASAREYGATDIAAAAHLSPPDAS